MGKHDKLPPIPSDEELAELAKFAAEHPDERSNESEVGEGERIEVPLEGFGSASTGYGGLNAGQIALGVDMVEDATIAEDRWDMRERDERQRDE